MTGGALPLGAVVVTEGDWRSLVSRAIRHATGSAWTHAFVVTASDELTEAWWPRVRVAPLTRRLAELDQQGRAYRVLDLPGISPEQRRQVAAKARSYVGRAYATRAVLGYYLTGNFREERGDSPFCFRLVTASYYGGAGINLYSCSILEHHYPVGHPRRGDVAQGYTLGADLFTCKLRPVSPLEGW